MRNLLSPAQQALLRHDAVIEACIRLHEDPYLDQLTVTLPDGRLVVVRNVMGARVRTSSPLPDPPEDTHA